jgi:type II secretory pathway pseudopilin PulG
MIGGIMTIERFRSRRDRARPTQPHSPSDSGIGLIEIVISMFLISLLAIAFIPVVVSAMRSSALNSTAATATRLVSQAVDDARTRSAADCAGAQLLNAQRDTVDAQGVTLRVTTSVPIVANCVNGSVITVTVTAVNLATAVVIADARTQIYLDGTP